MKDVLTFGERLSDLRTSRKLSQKELASKIGVGSTTIGGYESGRIFPKLDKLMLLAQIFDVSLDYIVGNSDLNIRNIGHYALDSVYHTIDDTQYTFRYLLSEMVGLTDAQKEEFIKALLAIKCDKTVNVTALMDVLRLSSTGKQAIVLEADEQK